MKDRHRFDSKNAAYGKTSPQRQQSGLPHRDGDAIRCDFDSFTTSRHSLEFRGSGDHHSSSFPNTKISRYPLIDRPCLASCGNIKNECLEPLVCIATINLCLCSGLDHETVAPDLPHSHSTAAERANPITEKETTRWALVTCPDSVSVCIVRRRPATTSLKEQLGDRDKVDQPKGLLRCSMQTLQKFRRRTMERDGSNLDHQVVARDS